MEFNMAEVHEALAREFPDRECIVFRDRRLTWRDVTERTRRLANYLLGRGLGAHRERSELAGWESGQDHLALYLYNGNEYLESMLGAYKARVAPFNVNYRYVEDELLYLLRDAQARAVVYHSRFAPILDKVRSSVPSLDVLIQVADDSGIGLLSGAVDYDEALKQSSPERPDVTWTPDDLYIIYTGGTTGMPKGVLWRQADVIVGAFAGRKRNGTEFESLEDLLATAHQSRENRVLPAPPFMHGAAHWAAFANFLSGNPVIVQSDPTRLDARDVLETVARERATILLIVGDAFARPLLDELERGNYRLPHLGVLITGGAALNAAHKRAFLERIPGLRLIDSIGSSEAGHQGQQISTSGQAVATGTFQPGPGSCVLNEDLTRCLAPGDSELGWFAKRGRVPLGYLNDAAKTARTFPVVDGVRYSVPGDRARHRADGGIEVHGRDSVTINSGGEKIFAEEVEHALKSHAAVYDAVVVGRPSERWGEEVVALVRIRAGHQPSTQDLIEACSQHLARFKLPKAILLCDEIVRSPSGKADYRWAKEQARARRED
jgi:3-oxocholest-4-en-26-oate---CoA ligase